MSVERFFVELSNHPEAAKWFDQFPHILDALDRAENNESVRAIVENHHEFADMLKRFPALQKELFNGLTFDEWARNDGHNGHLLAQVYGDPKELPNLDLYLVDAVFDCRNEAINRTLKSSTSDQDSDLDDADDDLDDEQSTDGPAPPVVDTEEGLAYAPSSEPLTFAEEVAFVDKIREVESIDFKEEDEFDVINKAKHYNLHPSGVECIELAEKLSFNLGNAFKYVFRRDDKDYHYQDLRKAEYYLKREIDRLTALLDMSPSSHSILLHPNLTRADERKVRRIVAVETSSVARQFYTSLFSNAVLGKLSDLSTLHRALGSLSHLIQAASISGE